MNKLIIFSCIYLLLLSCNNEESSDIVNYKDSRCDCINNMKFECSGINVNDKYFFSAILNDQEFCVKSSSYTNHSGIGSISTPTKPNEPFPTNSKPFGSFFEIGLLPPILDNNNGILIEYSPIITIKSPTIVDSFIKERKDYLDTYFSIGNFNIASKKSKDSSIFKLELEAYSFEISWVCVLRPGYKYYLENNPFRIPSLNIVLSTKPGDQKNSKFQITKSDVVAEAGKLYLDLEIEIECDLYYNSDYESYRYFGRLNKGLYKTRILYE